MDDVEIKTIKGRTLMVECINGLVVLTPLTPGGVGVPYMMYEEQATELIGALTAARDESRAESAKIVQAMLLNSVGTDGPG